MWHPNVALWRTSATGQVVGVWKLRVWSWISKKRPKLKSAHLTMPTMYLEVVMSRLTAKSWTSESTRRPVWTMGLRSSRSPQADPAWHPPDASATSPLREASTCLNPLSLPLWLKMSPLHSQSRACEYFPFSFEVIIFRHELLAGVGSEQVLCSFLTNYKINNLIPKL